MLHNGCHLSSYQQYFKGVPLERTRERVAATRQRDVKGRGHDVILLHGRFLLLAIHQRRHLPNGDAGQRAQRCRRHRRLLLGEPCARTQPLLSGKPCYRCRGIGQKMIPPKHASQVQAACSHAKRCTHGILRDPIEPRACCTRLAKQLHVLAMAMPVLNGKYA